MSKRNTQHAREVLNLPPHPIPTNEQPRIRLNVWNYITIACILITLAACLFVVAGEPRITLPHITIDGPWAQAFQDFLIIFHFIGGETLGTILLVLLTAMIALRLLAKFWRE